MSQENILRIVTVIENNDYLKKVAGNIAQISNASMVASSRYTTDVVDLCTSLSPDIVICDLSDADGNMSNKIKEICKVRHASIKVIATASSKEGESYMSDSIKNGADLFMKNLDNPEVLRSTLRVISGQRIVSQDKKNFDLICNQKVDELLHKFKLPVHFNGYYFLKSAIIHIAKRESKLPDVSCKLYEKVAADFNFNPRQVERAISKSVNYINEVCSKDYILNAILGYSVDTDNYSLNAKELIALIADQLRLNNSV